MGKEPGWTTQDDRRGAAPPGTAGRREEGRARRAAIGATTAVLLIAAGAATAQHLRANQRTNITVRVAGTLGVQMPVVRVECSDCALAIPLTSNWNLPPGAALGVTFLAQLAEPNPKLATPAATYRAQVRGRGSSSAVLHLTHNLDAEPRMLTIEVQNY